ncbi:MAG: phosphoribosylglycinamide formyltransferase [Bacteroidales bacterium]
MINIAVFASGSGTNFQALVDYFSDNRDINISLLLCNRPGAMVLERAERAGIKNFVFTRQELENTSVVKDIMESHNIHFIVLAGFLLKIPKNILETWSDRIVNIHPALLPKYGGKGMYGMKVHKAVIESGDRFSGITIHMINEEYDKGNIVSQHTCEVREDDTPESLAGRIHELEHYWYPRIIEKLLVTDA